MRRCRRRHCRRRRQPARAPASPPFVHLFSSLYCHTRFPLKWHKTFASMCPPAALGCLPQGRRVRRCRRRRGRGRLLGSTPSKSTHSSRCRIALSMLLRLRYVTEALPCGRVFLSSAGVSKPLLLSRVLFTAALPQCPLPCADRCQCIGGGSFGAGCGAHLRCGLLLFVLLRAAVLSDQSALAAEGCCPCIHYKLPPWLHFACNALPS